MDLPTLPVRPEGGHKGTFGTVCVIGGQAVTPRVMIGGPAFSASGALRSGCGLVVLAVPAPIMNSSIEITPSATGLALPVDANGDLLSSDVAGLIDQHIGQWDCIAIGPGLGEGMPQQQVVLRLANLDDTPLVIDADAINALASVPDFQHDFHSPAILTPHPGEFRRLAGALNIDADPVSAESRVQAARQLAQVLGCVVVLKGMNTVVSDGAEDWVNETGGPALATAGTGDVLTGVIAGFVAQYFKRAMGMGSHLITAQQQGGMSLFDCARLGVYVHGRAADVWSARHGDAGLLATDLLNAIPDVLSAMRDGS